MKHTVLIGMLMLLISCTSEVSTPKVESSLPQAHSGSTLTTASGTQIEVQEVTYFGNTKGYLAYKKDGDTKQPAVLLIHEWWGLNNNMKDIAASLAEAGYVTFAVDLYDGKLATTREEAAAYSTAVRNAPTQALQNLDAAVRHLKTLPYVDGEKLGAIGYCFGGTWSYEMARQTKDLKASVVYYGRFDSTLPFQNSKTALLGHFGEKDTSIPLTEVEKLTSMAQKVNSENTVYTYKDAAHAFANKGGANYREAEANLAWERTLAFLKGKLQ